MKIAGLLEDVDEADDIDMIFAISRVGNRIRSLNTINLEKNKIVDDLLSDLFEDGLLEDL